MAPTFIPTTTSTIQHFKRGLSKTGTIGVSVSAVVFVIIVIVPIVCYLYIKGWRLTRKRHAITPAHNEAQQSMNPHASNRSFKGHLQQMSMNLKLPVSRRETKYWSADDIDGKSTQVGNSKRQSRGTVLTIEDEDRIVYLPTPNVGFQGRTPVDGEKTRDIPQMPRMPMPVRPGSRRVKTWSRHISMQLLRASSETKRTSRATMQKLDWQEYEGDGTDSTVK